MSVTYLPDIVIVVSRTHWQCVTCRVHHKRTVSLDDHLNNAHPCVSPPPPPARPVASRVEVVLSDGEEFEDVAPAKQVRSVEKQLKPVPRVNRWLKQTGVGDSSEDVVDVDNDDDSDFVPSDLEDKSVKASSSKVITRTLRNHPKRVLVNRPHLRSPRKEDPNAEKAPDTTAESEPDEISEFEQPTEHEHTEAEDEERSKPRRGRPSTKDGHTSVRKKTKRGKQRATEPAVADSQSPRKRGRPPKPKPEAQEGEEVPTKRAYRKRIPDSSELLLKLRNVGRKPNTRKKVQGEEASRLKTTYAKFVSMGNTGGNISEQVAKAQAEDRNSSLAADNHVKEDSGQDVIASSSSQDTAKSPTATPQTSNREKVRCKTCLFLFNSVKLLEDHLIKVSAEDIVQCLACEMKFHGMIDLNLHVFCDHEYEKQPVCFLCQEEFRSMEKLERHLHRQHRGGEDRRLADTRFHDCRLCLMELNTDFQLIRNHYYRRHKAYICPECYGKDVELLFYTDTHLYSEHKQMHAQSPTECTICGQVFPTSREMKAHMWTHADDTEEDGTGGKCSKCSKWLPNAGAMLMHEKEHKNEAIRKSYALEATIGFPCLKCEHIFSSKSNLKKHSCRADPNRTFFFHCEYCAHGCNTKEQLRDHIALHHLGIKRYSCQHCDQRFVCAPTLRRHVRRVHTLEKPYACHLCGERFYERNMMLRHVSKHTGSASFVCEVCGKSFHTKFDLKKHVENHTDTRNFVCPNCGLDYKRSYHLKRHQEKGCKKRSGGDPLDENIPSVVSEAPLAAREDADDLVYMDLADEDTNVGTDQHEDDADMNNYNDESSGPEYIDHDGDDTV